jgi:hypothetical protein
VSRPGGADEGGRGGRFNPWPARPAQLEIAARRRVPSVEVSTHIWVVLWIALTLAGLVFHAYLLWLLIGAFG